MAEINDVVVALDRFAASDAGRLKVLVSEELAEGETQKQYHHGRCDIGSPWERGCAFDVLE